VEAELEEVVESGLPVTRASIDKVGGGGGVALRLIGFVDSGWG